MQYAGSESERRSAEKAGRGSWCWRNKMIVGIGTDLIEIERIKKACEKEAFLMAVYIQKKSVGRLGERRPGSPAILR